MTDTTDGPSGGHGPTPFSDSPVPQGSRIAKIDIHHGNYIDSIRIFYEVNGREYPGAKQGGEGQEPDFFELVQGEYITGISGTWGDYIDGLQIHTNKRTSKMYGANNGPNSYQYDAGPSSAIVGFFGSYGAYIDSIGVIKRG